MESLALNKSALIVMAKRPFPGQTKTRLVPPFSLEEAADLYERILLDTLELVGGVAGVTPFVAYAPPNQEAAGYFRRLAPDFECLAQTGNSLGERLDGVLSICLELGFDQAVAMNSDSPTLPVAYLDEAFRRLHDPQTDVVLGPCEDGGYYLIGWKRPHSRLVREVEMSTDRVLADTLKLAAEEHLKVALLPSWFDIDDMDALQRIAGIVPADRQEAGHTRRFLAEIDPGSARFLGME